MKGNKKKNEIKFIDVFRSQVHFVWSKEGEILHCVMVHPLLVTTIWVWLHAYLGQVPGILCRILQWQIQMYSKKEKGGTAEANFFVPFRSQPLMLGYPRPLSRERLNKNVTCPSI